LGDIEKNIEQCQTMLSRCHDLGADFAVLPEMWLTGYAFRNLKDLASAHTADTVALVGELAKTYRMNIAAGSFPELENGKIYNSAYVFDRTGDVTERYRKIHLFSYTGEERFMAGGGALPNLVESEDGKYGVTVCYDIRFPEIYRPLGVQGAEMIFVPAQLPHPRLHHWRILLQARAIENQAYVIGCNRVGQVKHLSYFGHSMIIDPWGEVLAEGDEQEAIVWADIDLTTATTIRETMTVFKDRVPPVYQTFRE
jgi:predicted amidohydrolase